MTENALLELDLDAMTPEQAASTARKAARQRLADKKQFQQRRDVAQREADSHALNIILRYFDSRDSMPQAWEKRDPLDGGCCATVDQDSGDVTLHGAHHNAKFSLYPTTGIALSHVFENPAGVFAVSAYDHYNDKLIFMAVGMCDGVLEIRHLPEEVGAWLNHGADVNSH